MRLRSRGGEREVVIVGEVRFMGGHVVVGLTNRNILSDSLGLGLGVFFGVWL